MLVYLQKITNQVKLMLLPWFDACGGEPSTSICLFMCLEVVAWGAMALSKVIATLGYNIIIRIFQVPLGVEATHVHMHVHQ